MITTKNVIPHVYVAEGTSKSGAKGARSYLKRKCRRAVRRALKIED